VRLGFWPGVSIVHTSKDEEGQVYIPAINTLLAIGCVAITLGFRTSDHLAAAYGMAVTGTMAITSVLFYVVARQTWRWSRALAGGVTLLFLVVDGAFLGANLPKAVQGGWLPLALAAAFFVVMNTWHRGREIVEGEVLAAAIPIDAFLADLDRDPPRRTPGVSVVLTPSLDVAPPVLLHFFRHAKVLHEHVVLLSVRTCDVPTVADTERIARTRELGHGFQAIEVVFGFKQALRISDALAAHEGFRTLDTSAGVSFLLGRESLTVATPPRMARWRRLLFGFLFRNARPVSSAFQLPAERTMELRVDVSI
jgi:KUP system potassium uptake protein